MWDVHDTTPYLNCLNQVLGLGNPATGVAESSFSLRWHRAGCSHSLFDYARPLHVSHPDGSSRVQWLLGHGTVEAVVVHLGAVTVGGLLV